MGMGQLPILQPGPPPLRRPAKAGRPPWLKVRLPGGENYTDLKRLVRRLDLNTVCESARCPNLAECWQHRTATFMILGNTCTRACGFCAVPSGKPDPAMDWDEPRRVAEAAAHMELKYAVVTSVNRDDQPDGGAAIFAATIGAIRERLPECKIEVLIPDFRGDWAALAAVLAARPDVLNHNTETVPRLYRQVRRGALYARSLELLQRAKQLNPRIPTKSGIMVGLGESYGEIIETLRDLRAQQVDILTVGQYLQPTAQHLPIARFYHPDEFAAIKRAALALGFKHAECGPLVRSSYHAHEQQEAAAASLA
jgi:lipoic acid synthetase